MYQRVSMKIKLNSSDKSDSTDVTQDVLQGDSLSPLIFAILLHDIIDFFKEDGHVNVEESVEILLFADDLTILATDIVDLQNKLDTLAKYCKIKKLEVNTKKTEIIIFKKSRRPKRLRTVKFNNIPLKVVKSYTFSSMGSFKPTLDHALSKGKSAIGAIWQILAIGKNTSWDTASNLFEVTVAINVLYSSGIWELNHTMDIERIQTDSFLVFRPTYPFFKNTLLLERVHIRVTGARRTTLSQSEPISGLEALFRLVRSRAPYACTSYVHVLTIYSDNRQDR